MLQEIFFFDTEVGQVSAMNDKVDRVELVDVFYEILCFIIPALCITGKNKTDSVFFCTGFFNPGDIGSVDVFVFFVRNSPVIRVIVYQVAGGEQDDNKALSFYRQR